MQIPFIENKGQIDDDHVRYYARTFGGTLFITEDGEIVYSFGAQSRSGGTPYIRIATEQASHVGAGLAPPKR